MKPIRGGLLSAVGAALLLLALSPAISWAAYPGANGRIAYAGHPGPEGAEHSHIYTVLPSGAGLQQLTDSAISDGQPSWSADGKRLVFVRSGQVFTMTADGGNQTQVTHDNGIDTSPGFSPNGRRIVFAKDNDDAFRIIIFKIRTDGTDKRRIVTGYVMSPSYSPDGRRIVFEGSPQGKSGSPRIWTVHPNGSHLRRLTAPRPGRWDQSPEWSPDGQHIVFQRCYNDDYHTCDGDLYLMRANGSYKHPIKPLTGNIPPAYSPAGDRIALTSYVGDYVYVWCTDIYTITPTGSDSQAVTDNCDDPYDGGYAGKPTWQPIPQP
jgi:Tol biopolymer transport system component